MKSKFTRFVLLCAFAALAFATVYAVEIGGVTYTHIPMLSASQLYVASGDQGNGSASIGGNLSVTGAVSTASNLTVTGNATVTGSVKGKVAVVNYITTATARTITAAESGTVFTMSETSDDPTTFTLPAAAAGLRYTFIDMDATANADLVVDTATGDKINNQTAGVSYDATGDAFGDTLELFAVDDTNWVVFGKVGTWAQGR